METFENLNFYRGMSERYPCDRPFLHEPRKDRRPKDSSQRFHDAADQWFFDTFGVKYRTHGVFVTSSRLTAQHYAHSPAHVMRVVPCTSYKYCWSPIISDLLFKAKELEDADVETIRNFLDSARYCESELGQAQELRHEVMISCERYLAIPVGLFPEQKSEPGSGLILPFGK